MYISYFKILAPVIGLSVNVIVQLISFRFISGVGLLKSEYSGFFAGFFSLLFIEFHTFFLLHLTSISDFIAILLTNLIIYCSLGYCYFHFINLGETARRIRILRELYDRKEGLSMEEIFKRYNAKEIFERRIARLINNGQIIYKDGKYYIGKPIMLLMAKMIVTMKLILLREKSEFD